MPQQYKIPQDLLKSEKIFGPLTLKGFGIVCGAGAFSFVISRLFNDQTWPFVVAPVAILTIFVVFVRIHKMSFSDYLVAKLLYILRPRKRVWIMHAAEIDATQDYKVDTNKADKKKQEARIKKARQHKVQLAHNVKDISHMVDGLRQAPEEK